jgi:DNA-binding MarR family transcriptional regulator
VKSSSDNAAKPLSRHEARKDPVQEATGLRVALMRIHRQLRSHTVAGLTLSQGSALARIEQLGPLRLGLLAEAEGTTAATMCKVIDSLEERKFIERVADPLDGRASLIQLGEEGGTLLSELRQRSTEALRTAMGEMSASERETVSRAIPVLEHLSELLSRVER